MKRMKKLSSLVLALIMVLAMAIPAAAAEGSNSITVKNAQKDETYKIYKMMDLVVNVELTAYSYKVNAEWADFFGENGAGKDYITEDSQGYVSWVKEKMSASDMEEFGKQAAAYAKENSLEEVGKEIPTADGDITFESLESGYYLITSTNGTLAIVDTTPTNPNREIKEKNVDSSLEKSVEEDSTSVFGTGNSAQIGDTVNFQVKIYVKKGALNYVMHDTMDDGLTFDKNSVEIKNGETTLTKDDYTVKEGDEAEKACSFHIEFTQTYLDSLNADTEFIVTYSATLNENAKIITGEENKAYIAWGDGSTSTEVKTITKTYQFEVRKYAKGDTEKKNLAGAEFQLKKDNETVKLVKIDDMTYRVANGEEEKAVESFVTVADGNIVIKGVDLDDDYTLVEIKAPAGYNTLEDSVPVEVNKDNNWVAEIENATGSELPSTGGIGTTIFYVVGGILVVAAAVLLVTRKRMSTEK